MCRRSVKELRQEGVLLAVANHLVSQMDKKGKEHWAAVGMIAEIKDYTIRDLANLVEKDGFEVRQSRADGDFLVISK